MSGVSVWDGLIRELEAADLLSNGHFAYRSGMHSLRLLDRDACLSDTRIASRLGYALAKHFFLTRVDVVATPSIWGGGLAQWVGYFLDPKRPVIYARVMEDEYRFTPSADHLDGKRVLIVDNLILSGDTITNFVRAISANGGTPIGIAVLADLSGIDYPIEVFGLLNEELKIFDPTLEPEKGQGIPIVEVGY